MSIQPFFSGQTVQSCTAIILAGGRATRLGGVNKALLDIGGKPVVQRVLDSLRPLATQILVVGHLVVPSIASDVEVLPDVFPHAGSLGGIYTGLMAARHDLSLAVGCDMPFLSPPLLRLILQMSEGYDAAVPRIGPHLEALHASYRRTCLPVMKEAIDRGNLKIIDCYPRFRLREVPEAAMREVDPELRSFLNINTPGDLDRARDLAAMP